MTPEEIIQNNLYNNEHIYLLSKSDIKVVYLQYLLQIQETRIK